MFEGFKKSKIFYALNAARLWVLKLLWHVFQPSIEYKHLLGVQQYEYLQLKFLHRVQLFYIPLILGQFLFYLSGAEYPSLFLQSSYPDFIPQLFQAVLFLQVSWLNLTFHQCQLQQL